MKMEHYMTQVPRGLDAERTIPEILLKQIGSHKYLSGQVRFHFQITKEEER